MLAALPNVDVVVGKLMVSLVRDTPAQAVGLPVAVCSYRAKATLARVKGVTQRNHGNPVMLSPGAPSLPQGSVLRRKWTAKLTH